MSQNNGLIFKCLRTNADTLDLSPVQKLVLLILLNHWNPKKSGAVVWPGQQRIADHSGLCIRAVRGALMALEQAGYIKIEQGHGLSNQYQIHAEVIHSACDTPAPDAPTPALDAGVPRQDMPHPRQQMPVTPAANADECLSECPSNAFSEVRHSASPTKGGDLERAGKSIPECLMANKKTGEQP